jgi:hypothetical protein
MHSKSRRKAFNRMLFVGYQLIDLRWLHFCKENDVNETNEMSKAQMAIIIECCAKRVPKSRGKAGQPSSLENITNSSRRAARPSATPRKKASKVNMSARLMKNANEERLKNKSGCADRSKYCCVPMYKI